MNHQHFNYLDMETRMPFPVPSDPEMYP